MNTQNKSLGYTLFIDQEIDALFHIFSALFDSFEEFSKTTDGIDALEKDKMRDVFRRFLEATTEPSHELGWCKDPECTWKPKERI